MTLYDKQEAESGRAFAAFTTYRDIGANRSLNGAYRCQTGVGKGAGRASGQWVDWYDKHDWKRRAEAWDGAQDKQRRQEQAETHRQELEAYRGLVIERARKMAGASTSLLEAALQALQSVDVSNMKPSDIPAFVSASASALEKAVKLEGIGLGVLGENGEPLTQ